MEESLRPRAQLANQERTAPTREEQTESRTGHRHDKALGEEQPREPPSAILTLSSRRRAGTRATNRLAMFVQATSQQQSHRHDHRNERLLEL